MLSTAAARTVVLKVDQALWRALFTGKTETERWDHKMGVSENVVYPIVPNGFADHYPVFKWLAIIGNINPTFSDKPK